MQRDCKTCQKNVTFPPRFGCGYLPENERQFIEYDIAELDNPSFNVNICPVFFFNENSFIYDFISDAKTIPVDRLSFTGRTVLRIYNDFINLLIEHKTKQLTNRSSNG